MSVSPSAFGDGKNGISSMYVLHPPVAHSRTQFDEHGCISTDDRDVRNTVRHLVLGVVPQPALSSTALLVSKQYARIPGRTSAATHGAREFGQRYQTQPCPVVTALKSHEGMSNRRIRRPCRISVAPGRADDGRSSTHEQRRGAEAELKCAFEGAAHACVRIHLTDATQRPQASARTRLRPCTPAREAPLLQLQQQQQQLARRPRLHPHIADASTRGPTPPIRGRPGTEARSRSTRPGPACDKGPRGRDRGAECERERARAAGRGGAHPPGRPPPRLPGPHPSPNLDFRPQAPSSSGGVGLCGPAGTGEGSILASAHDGRERARPGGGDPRPSLSLPLRARGTIPHRARGGARRPGAPWALSRTLPGREVE